MLPLSILEDVKADVTQFAEKNDIGDFAKFIINKRYILDTPPTNFAAKSIVIAVWHQDVEHAVFTHKGRRAASLVEGGHDRRNVGGNTALRQLFADKHVNEQYVHWMPMKRIAVRAGLCQYGRNNITYDSDWGSFVRIGAYVTDIEPPEEYFWQEAKIMNRCSTCGACVRKCPTKALCGDRFWVDGRLCLANLNSGTDDIPKWVPKDAHRALYGCYICQRVCPANASQLANVKETVFDESETEIMLKSRSYADFPEEIRRKLWQFNIGTDFECLPRNLELMLDSESNPK